jgi:cytochrome oxidase Cu insertion factor (SCO1/SenC/PrrC family)
MKRVAWVVALLLSVGLSLRAQKNVPAATDAPAVGAKAPEFALPDTQGKTVRLADVLTGRKAAQGEPVLLLVFYRGYW